MANRLFSIVNQAAPSDIAGINILSPATGKIKAIEHPMHQRVGEGVTIELQGHSVVSPVNGTITDIMPAHGKVIVQAKNKMRFLIQLTSDYIQHNGLGIQALVHKGQQVTKRQPIFNFDLYKIQQELKPINLNVILLDTKRFKTIDVPHKHVEAGNDTVFTLVPKTN